MKTDNGGVRPKDKLIPNQAVVTEVGAPQSDVPSKRKSHITIGLKRTLNTAQFETLVIELATEEDIEWSTPEERSTKLRNWQKLFVEEFKEAHERILDELKLAHKKAYFKSTTAETAKRYQQGAQETVNDAGPLDDLNDLDILN